MQSERAKSQKIKNMDWITIVIVLALVTFGAITIANVMAEPITGELGSLGDIQSKLNMEYVQRHIVNFLVGVAACLVMVAIDYHVFEQIIKYIYIVNLILLALLIASASSTRGVLGWYYVGTRAFQPSELCKITLTISLSKLAADAVGRDGALRSMRDIAKILLNFMLPFLLVLWQPDFGTAIVFVAILACILFVSKISWKYVVAGIAAVGAMAPISYYYLFSDDQVKRIDVFLDPSKDPQGAGMHVISSKISIGSGQLMGKGYFTQGTLAQLKFVPERHTDFIFSGIAEGLGFVGGAVLIAVYFLLMFRWLWVAIRAKDHFGTCIVIGLTGMMMAHVFENIGMTIGLMPVTGIPLPFVSYGGSNILTNMMGVGLVLNVWMRRQQRR